jgi:hypothetical protein
MRGKIAPGGRAKDRICGPVLRIFPDLMGAMISLVMRGVMMAELTLIGTVMFPTKKAAITGAAIGARSAAVMAAAAGAMAHGAAVRSSARKNACL